MFSKLFTKLHKNRMDIMEKNVKKYHKWIDERIKEW
jgi:hypothetical protein